MLLNSDILSVILACRPADLWVALTELLSADRGTGKGGFPERRQLMLMLVEGQQG